MESFKQKYCLRVTQLDTKLLDTELFSAIDSILSQIEVEKVRELRPELLALIKCYVWFNTINKNGISVGQSLLQSKYYDLSRSDCIKDGLNLSQTLSFVLTQILCPTIKERMSSLTKRDYIKNLMEFVEYVYKTLDFVNSLLFLYYGKYGSLWERLFKIGIGLQSIKQKTNNSELYVEIMTRELLWNSFAEFLTFVLPLINFYRLRNSFKHLLRTSVFGPSSQTCPQIHSNIESRDLNDLKVCVICNEWPVDGHEIGCKHVFCYYCLMSNFMSDQKNGFTCDKCYFKTDSIESIKRRSYFMEGIPALSVSNDVISGML